MLISPRASGVCCCPCLRLTHTIIYISFGFPRMDVFYLGRSRPRHIHRPSAAHSRSGGEVHVCRKVWQTRKVTIRTRYWLYSQPSFAAPTINWSWRGSRSARLGVLYLRRSLLECQDTYGGLFLRAAGLFCISTRHAHTNVCKYLISGSVACLCRFSLSFSCNLPLFHFPQIKLIFGAFAFKND